MLKFTHIDEIMRHNNKIQMHQPIKILIWSIVMGICVHASGQEPVLIDKVVAKVGGEVILLSEVEGQLAYMQAQRGSLPPDARCQVIASLMAQNLLLHQAKVDSIKVTDEEVNGIVDSKMERILGLMNNDFQQFEDYYGKTPSQVREEMREPSRNQTLIERMQATILNSIQITPSEVKAFFSRVPKDSLPFFNSEVEMAEIIYYPKVNNVQKQNAYAEISRLRKLITEGGKSFSEVASKYSNDQGSARQGGDLGWQKRGTFVPEFEAIAYNLEPGELSEIFESPFGYHFVELLERRGNLLHTRHILIQPVIEQSDLDLAAHVLDSIRTKILSDSTYSFEYALKQVGFKETQSFHNGGRMMNPSSGNTFFEINDLDHKIFFVIDTMQVGQISRPIQLQDPTGKTYFQIIRLLNRTKPHKASLKQDYAKIQEAALAEKKNNHLENWVQRHIDMTFIDVAPEYHHCAALATWIQEMKQFNKP